MILFSSSRQVDLRDKGQPASHKQHAGLIRLIWEMRRWCARDGWSWKRGTGCLDLQLCEVVNVG